MAPLYFKEQVLILFYPLKGREYHTVDTLKGYPTVACRSTVALVLH